MRDDSAAVFLIVGLVVAVVIGLTIAILFYLTLSRCLSRIRPHNREMEPPMVWLNLIPCLGTIWIFFTIIKIANSLRKEFSDRGWPSEGESFGQSVGMGYAVCAALGWIPYVGAIFGIPALVCFIMYWVQIANFSRQLEEPYEGRRRRRYEDDDRDEDFDDLPARPRRRDEDSGPPDERIRSTD